MNKADKIALALRALQRHHDVYGRKMPRRLLDFWKSGQALEFDGQVLAERSLSDELRRWELRTCVPAWEVLGQIGGIDVGVVGPQGEWEYAKDFVPLFHAETHFFFVANITDAMCPVGYYEDETFNDEGDGYRHGVHRVALSLDRFLGMLRRGGDIDVECSSAAEIKGIWEGAAEHLDAAAEETGKDSEVPLVARLFAASINRGSGSELEARPEDAEEMADDSPATLPPGRPVQTGPLLTPSAALARLIGAEKVSRVEATSRIWTYVKRHGLQDPKARKTIHCDAAFKAVSGKASIEMREVPAILDRHLK